MKDAQGGSVFDELQSFCYHADVGGRKIELERSDRYTPVNFGTLPRHAGALGDDYGSAAGNKRMKFKVDIKICATEQSEKLCCCFLLQGRKTYSLSV